MDLALPSKCGARGIMGSAERSAAPTFSANIAASAKPPNPFAERARNSRREGAGRPGIWESA